MSEEPLITTPPPESEFGQEYSLLKALNKLVRDYSLGVGLFKEFIQNADDAEATEIRFILDQTFQTNRTFHHPKLAHLVGPSLLVWNNSAFKEQDIKSIRSLGDTEKVLKPASTGKFGLGFNTCYNVTDYPLLLTGGNVYLFDPHKTAYDYSDSAPPGKCWPLTPQLWSSSPALLSPFAPLGLSFGQSAFPGTAFRLPLRTSDHDVINGQIKRGPVTPEKIQELFQDFTRFAPSILLFLKHLLRIEFLVSNGQTTVPSPVLLIETSNPEMVTKGRAAVNAAIKCDIPGTLQHLVSQVDDSISSIFKHSLKVTHLGTSTPHNWLVSTGLFRGSDDVLLKAAAELWDRKEKAVPWAGAACPIPKSGEAFPNNFQGHAFCFLPLPDALGGCRIPVHINGFFDVDTSRKGLTHEASATGTVERLRAEWNRTLIKEAVAVAYSRMLAHLVELDPNLDPADFYNLWLDPNQGFPQPLDSLPAALYAKLTRPKLLRSAASNWQAASDLRTVAPALRPPLVAEKWSKIPDPAIPAHIQDGYKSSGNPLKALDPADLRSFFEAPADINCPLAKAPRLAVRDREWLTAIASFALPKAPATALSGQPILLLADGTLHTIGHRSAPAYLAGPAERKLFAQHTGWFVDAEYAQAVSFPEVSTAQVLKMTPEHVLAQLAQVLPMVPEHSYATWTPGAKEPPNEDWLASVFQFFLDQPESWKPSDDLLSKACIVPDQHHHLWPAGNNLTPLLVSPGLDPRLRSALQTLGVQIVTGGPKLLQVIEAFAARFSKIWSITPRDLADTLHESRAAWSAKLPTYSSAACDPILQFFAGKDSLDALAQLANSRADKLRELPLFPCQNEELVTIQGNQCFIAAEVSPPAVALPIKLLRPGTWKDLLVALKLQPLKVRAIIQDILLPNYANLTREEQLTALAWIRDHMDQALTEAGDDQKALLSALRSAKLVLSSKDVLSECRHLYIRNDRTIREVLGDFALTPSESLYGQDWERWLSLFERLGICKTPRPQDLACHIDKLKKIFEPKADDGPAPAQEVLANTEKQLVSVLQHIIQNWPILRDGQISMSGGGALSFKDYLRTREWCPPLRGEKNLKHLVIAVEPPAKLFPPTQLYPPILGHLVASLNHLLPIEQRDSIPDAIREIMPELVTPPVATVSTHFTNLLAKLNGSGSPDPKVIKVPLQRIYSYFGQLEPTDAAPLRTLFADKDCIYVGNEARFRKPKDTFRESVPYATPWWSQSYFGPPEIESGLTALGRKEKPELADLCRLTREIHDSTSDELAETEEAQFIRILVRIEELLPEQDPLPEMCLLDRDARPVFPADLFFHDATWLDDKLEQSPVHLHHPQLPAKLLARLNLSRLSDHILTEPEGFWPETENRDFLDRCAIIETLLKRREFITGLRRILSRSSIATNDVDLDWLSQVHISSVKTLQCTHHVLDDGKKVFLATSEELFYHTPPDSAEYTLTLSEAGTDVLYEQVAVALQHWIGAEDLQDLSPLAKILQCPPNRIESILDKLRVRRLEDANVPTEEQKKGADGRSPLFDEGGDQTGKQEDDSKKQANGDADQRQSGTGGQQQGGASGQRQGGGQKQPGDASRTGGQRGGSSKGGGGDSGGHSQGSRRGRGGSRSTSASKTESRPKSRLLSYAATESQRQQSELDEDNADDEIRPNKEIGDWAVHWVLQYERSQGRDPDPANHLQNRRGFDVLSRSNAPSKPRYIEVKGIDGNWNVDGVPLYPAQLDFARQHGEDFWLYVVEHARAPERVIIHTIQDPAQKITQYRFDCGWKTIAAPLNNFKANTVKIGSCIRWHQNGEFRLGRVVAVGPVLQVEVENQNRNRIGIANRPLQFEIL